MVETRRSQSRSARLLLLLKQRRQRPDVGARWLTQVAPNSRVRILRLILSVSVRGYRIDPRNGSIQHGLIARRLRAVSKCLRAVHLPQTGRLFCKNLGRKPVSDAPTLPPYS